MRAIVVVAGLLFSCAALQEETAVCRFRDVVDAPERPAVLDTATRRPPRLEYFLSPAHAWTVRAWVRVAPSGEVSDVCVPDAPEGFNEAFADAARQVRFAPARENGRAVASVSAVLYEFGGRFEGQSLLTTMIGTSTEVRWLEGIAGSPETALNLWRSRAQSLGQPKDLRVAAFARLGEIGTAESVEAQRRVTAVLAGRPLVPYDAALDVKWAHPGWHMSDYAPAPIARIRTGAGAHIAIIQADLLGPPQLFVLRCADDALSRCSRPKPFAPSRWRHSRIRAALTETASGHLRLEIVSASEPAAERNQPRKLPEGARPETHDIDLARVEQDSDGDGWADLEEQTLGLDPASRDSDSDGTDDARDRAPLFVRRAPSDGEDAEILRAAIFAIFGVTESRWVLFAQNDTVPRIEVPGLSAPVIFHRPLNAGPGFEAPGGVFVTWKLVRKTATEAVVAITDWEGSLAAGGQDVFLRRVDGRWVVVARQTTWIS